MLRDFLKVKCWEDIKAEGFGYDVISKYMKIDFLQNFDHYISFER